MKRMGILALSIAMTASCAEAPSSDMTQEELRLGVSAPTFSPAAGAVSDGTTVSATSTTSSSTTRCTTDGSTPTTSSPVCTNIVVHPPITVKARAFASWRESSVVSASYTLQSSTTTTPPTTTPPTTTTTPPTTTTTPPTTTTTPSATIQLIGNKIYDTGGQPIVARGPEMTVDGSGRTADVDAAAATGANAMRMLLTLNSKNGTTPQSFDAVLAEAVAKHMLVWVSLYAWDSGDNYLIGSGLGGGNFYSLAAPSGTGTCSSSTPGPCYLAMWSRQWLKDLMNKYRANVIIDAAQEYIGTADPSTEAGRAEWAAAAEVNVKFFRGQGYTNPLEVMSNFQGRDLYAIVEYGAAIRAVDTVSASGNPQTMFGWQAYWGTTDNWYPTWQGGLLAGSGKTVTGAQAIHSYAATQPFPIEIGIDNYAADTNLTYQAEIDQAAVDAQSWLWWSWQNGSDNVDCPVSGATCQQYVMHAANGFPSGKPLSK